MKHLIVILGFVLLAACEKSNNLDAARLSIYRAGWRNHLLEDSKIQHQGSHFFIVERAPITLKIWYICKGAKTQKGQVQFDPAIHESAFVSPFAGKVKSYIDFAARRRESVDGDSWDNFEIEFPTPYRIGCNDEESTTTIKDAQIVLKFWMIGSNNVDLPISDMASMKAMLSASAKKDITFLVIEAVPE